MRKPLIALAAIAALGTTAAAPAGASAAAAPCKQWNIANNYIKQANGWYVQVPQVGASLDGTAVQYAPNGYATGGEVQGAVTGNSFRFTTVWDNDTAGVYTGTIDRDGFVTGTAVDRFNPRSRTTFRALRRAKCTLR
jgi:hypothetical protein